MKKRSFVFCLMAICLGLILPQCRQYDHPDQSPELILKKGKPAPTVEAGNCLSFPVIWAEGVTKTLPGTSGMTPITKGVWWYQWGTNGVDPNVTPASCPPDPDEKDLALNPDKLPYCDDAKPTSLTLLAGNPAADNPLPLAKAYLQKDPNNTWQAESADWHDTPVNINWIDWGDNLESMDWYTRSQVRTEVVLVQDLATKMLEYQMRHTSGWGTDEVHGLAVDFVNNEVLLGEGTQATVYSHCARLTIQKLLVKRDDPRLSNLIWIPGDGWTEPGGYPFDLINPHIFNGSVHEGGDGPGFYSAEINVKGKIVYGYTWNVRQLNDNTAPEGSMAPTAAGDYRITFSFDDTCGPVNLNSHFVNGTTKIIVPTAEEIETAIILAGDSGDSGGGTAKIDFDNNLTYMDVRILEKGGSGGGGGRK